MTHPDNNAYNPGANWREEAHVRDSATRGPGAPRGRLGRQLPGRTYRWLDDNLYLRDGEAQALRIARTRASRGCHDRRRRESPGVTPAQRRHHPRPRTVGHAAPRSPPRPRPQRPPSPCAPGPRRAGRVRGLVDFDRPEEQAYGNGATAVFQARHPGPGSQVRIDDKLSRLGRGLPAPRHPGLLAPRSWSTTS